MGYFITKFVDKNFQKSPNPVTLARVVVTEGRDP